MREWWVVTPSVYGIETALVAVFDGGMEGSVVSYNVEYGLYVLCFYDGVMRVGIGE
jgi:hypothetical protein